LIRYILALVPSKKCALSFIQVAQSMFTPLNDGYLLNEENSLPHITVCAFECDESEKIEKLCEDLQNCKIDTCPVRILGLMLKKGKHPPYHYSVNLSIARDDPILQLHYKIRSILIAHQITPVNPSMELYQPHLLDSTIDDLISMPIEDFHLTLGRSDAIGQYLQILYEF
jgi:2'-5' RNA ligase